MKTHEKAAKQEQLQHYGQTKMYKPQYKGQTKGTISQKLPNNNSRVKLKGI
jgi:hypothetical protein